MKNFLRPFSIVRIIASLTFLFLFANHSNASHIVGMDLKYVHLTGNTYRIICVAYGDCGPASSAAFSTLPVSQPQICIYDANTLIGSINLNIQPPTDGENIAKYVICPRDTDSTTCTNSSYPYPGVKKFVYWGDYTLPYTSHYWRFIFTSNMGGGSATGRAAAITNIGGGTLTELMDTLDNVVGYNTSPWLTKEPIPFFCDNNPDTYNPVAVDTANGDSLRFYLVPGFNGTGSCSPTAGLVTYLGGYSATAPLAVVPGTMTFDNATGQLNFTPNALQRSLVVYNIREYRNDTFIGTSMREMNFIVIGCTSTPPSGVMTNPVNGIIQSDSVHFEICNNTGPFSFQIKPREPDTTNNIKVTATGLPTGCVLTVTNDSTNHPTCTFNWTSTGVLPGSYTFFMTFKDDHCPVNGQTVQAYTIIIDPTPNFTYSIISQNTCVSKGVVQIITGGTGSPWEVDDVRGTTTVHTYMGVTTSFFDTIPSGTDTFKVYAESSHYCPQKFFVTLAPAPPFVLSATKIDPSFCGFGDGKIVIRAANPGAVDTVWYKQNGVVITVPLYYTVASDSLVIISGLYAGVYDSITVKYGTCVSNVMGPLTLINPPFTWRTITSTDPTLCGLCNGQIILWGLHPGETDTINYTKNGVAQPPIYTFIGPDSQVVINGLCAGIYSNFVANSHLCFTTPLGPVTLTNPPFAIRAITSTNPSACGYCDGTITLYGLHPGETDTINYNFNGIAQPPVYAFIGPDSMVVMTLKCAGTYDGFVANAYGCISNTVGPVTLVNPPFTMSYLSYSSPTTCGLCNGKITVHGLHPGQLDTLNYNKDGVAQTAIGVVINADSSIQLTGLCAGVYDHFVANTAAVCISNILGPVTLINPTITPEFDTTIRLGCKGDTLRCFNHSLNATAMDSGLYYHWDFGDGGTDFAISPTHVYTQQGTFTISMTITNGYCDSTITKDITLNNFVKAGFVMSPNPVCQNEPVTLHDTSSGTNTTYKWFFGDGGTSSSFDETHSYAVSSVYTVSLVVTNDVPCRDTATKILYVDSLGPIKILVSDSTLCQGTSVTFRGIYTGIGNIGNTWDFNDGADSAVNINPALHTFYVPGVYNITLHSYYRACPNLTAGRKIWVEPNPSIFIGNDTTICSGENPIYVVDALNMHNPNASWKWNTGQTTSSILIGAPGTYYVTVTALGCQSTDTIIVDKDCYMDIPNVFTPNGDGLNDNFYPRQFLTKGLITFKMNIFNRWGQLIFETASLDGRGWDGTYNDSPQPEGVYIYIIEGTFKDGQKEKHQGNVTLLR